MTGLGQATYEQRLRRVEQALSELIRCVAALSPEDQAVIVQTARHLPEYYEKKKSP